MPKTPPPSRRGASSRRTAPTKVSKPFPWGVALGSTVLVLFLVGLLVYAATNQGSGVSDLQRNPDQAISGVTVAEEESLSRDHVAGQVDYPSVPPSGGAHNGVPQACAVYTEPIAPEHAVHSLEHGAVWVTYNEQASDEDVQALTEQVEGDPYRLLSPVPEQESPIQLTAWGRSLAVDSTDDERVEQFLEAYTNGPQTPEPGAACIGNATTGPLAGAPTDAPTMPSASDPASAPATSPPASPAAQ
jgi:hypothetical protein